MVYETHVFCSWALLHDTSYFSCLKILNGKWSMFKTSDRFVLLVCSWPWISFKPSKERSEYKTPEHPFHSPAPPHSQQTTKDEVLQPPESVVGSSCSQRSGRRSRARAQAAPGVGRWVLEAEKNKNPRWLRCHLNEYVCFVRGSLNCWGVFFGGVMLQMPEFVQHLTSAPGLTSLASNLWHSICLEGTDFSTASWLAWQTVAFSKTFKSSCHDHIW